MHGANRTGEDRTSKVDAMAEAIVAMFGERALSVVHRQIEAARGEVKVSWEAILVHVEIILSERR
jgi:hypothetical protein